jgi:hypothetical protein
MKIYYHTHIGRFGMSDNKKEIGLKQENKADEIDEILSTFGDVFVCNNATMMKGTTPIFQLKELNDKALQRCREELARVIENQITKRDSDDPEVQCWTDGVEQSASIIRGIK